MKFLLLALLFSLNAHAEDEHSFAQKTVPELKEDLAATKNSKDRFVIEGRIAKKNASGLLPASAMKDAQASAELLLKLAAENKKESTYGNAIHHANIVLGRIKLRENNVAAAKTYLELAAKTPGSATLSTFGPNMTLAKELLMKGEKAAVLKYFDACLVFWKSPEAKVKIADWKKSIAAGKIPRFGGNLSH